MSQPNQPTDPRTAGARILVVDDEPMVRQLLVKHLTRKGYSVTEAEDGKKALQLFGENPFDLVLSDVRMPGLDGLALLKAIKEFSPRIPVILISGYGDVETVVDSLKAGAENFLAKPLKMDQLSRLVEQSLALSCLLPPGGGSRSRMRQVTYMEAPSQHEYVYEMLYQVANSAVAVGFASGDLDNNLKLALVEAITNAMEHGNRWDPEKMVRMEAVAEPGELTVSIEDQGDGFRAQALNDPTDGENLLQERGRGVFLMHAIMDRIEYNEKGNRVTLGKRRRTLARS